MYKRQGLHPRNRHQQRYDLPALCQACLLYTSRCV
ncbi:RlmF-related methyltransferase [Klebsiella michiganensis]